jgi:hypothetical protein
MQHKFIRELAVFKFKRLRKATKRAKLLVDEDDNLIWVPNFMVSKYTWNKETQEVKILVSPKYLVSVLNLPIEKKFVYKRHDKNKFKT